MIPVANPYLADALTDGPLMARARLDKRAAQNDSPGAQ
jgi:hypothetical protein